MPQSKMATNINGRINLSREIPADLMATSSKLSPRLPKVIIDEIRIAMGIANVSREALAYHKHCPIVKRSRSLPTKSSMYFHNICIIKTKNAIKNVTINGPRNDLRISLSSFFNIVAI